MKKLMLLLLGSLLLQFQCNEDDDIFAPSTVVGSWQLEAVLADPGDGSGTFQDVASEKAITFNADSTFTSNGLGCVIFGDNTEFPATGAFNATQLFIDDCDLSLFYSLEVNRLLIGNFNCIEECSERYAPN